MDVALSSSTTSKTWTLEAELLWSYDQVPPEYDATPTFSMDGDYVMIDVTWPSWDQSIPPQPPQPELIGSYLFDARTGEPLPFPDPPEGCPADSSASYMHIPEIPWASFESHGGACSTFTETGMPDRQFWFVQNLLTGEVLHGPNEIETPLRFPFVETTGRDGSTLNFVAADGAHVIDLVTGEERIIEETVDILFVEETATHITRLGWKPGFLQTDELVELTSGHVTELNADPSVVCNFGVGLPMSGTTAVIGCDDGTARVFDTTTGDVIQQLRGHDGWPSAMFDETGRFVVTGATDRTAKVWDLQSQGEVGLIQPPEGYIADASLSVVGTRGAILVFPDEQTSLYSPFV